MSSPKNNAQVFPVSVPETTPNSVSRSLDASAFGLCSLDQHELEGLDMLLERGKTLDLLSTEVELVHKVMRMNNDNKKVGGPCQYRALLNPNPHFANPIPADWPKVLGV